MNLFIESHQRLLQKLIDGSVDFLVIGGYSVIFYGYMRTTGDTDLRLRPTNENRERLVAVLRNFNFDDDELQALATMDFTKHLVLDIGDPPERIDFLTYINSLTYDEADQQKTMADMDGMYVPFVHLNHLILSKINTGRAKDAADIEELQRIMQKRNSK